MGAKDDINIWRAFDDRVLVLLGHASADRDLEIWVDLLARGEEGEISIQLVIGIFPNGTRIKDNEVGLGVLESLDVPGVQQEARDPFSIVNIHLAAIGLDDESPGRLRF